MLYKIPVESEMGFQAMYLPSFQQQLQQWMFLKFLLKKLMINDAKQK